MTAPTYKAEVAFTTDPLSASPSYTDVTAYLRGFQIRRGRNTELERTQAGTATIRLNNQDRRFDPTYGDQNLFPRVNQRDVEAALDAADFTATNGATFARTTTAGQFNQGVAGLSVTAHATNTNSGVTVGSSGGITALAPVPQHNVTYSYSVYVKGATAVTFYIMVTWVDQAGVPISTTATSNQVASTSAFVRIKHEALTPPAGTKYARCQILFPTAGAGQTLYADQFQFERAQNASDWISAGPYYPNVVPMRRVRLTMTHNAVDYRLFTGFIEDWGQEYPTRPIQNSGDAEVVVTASDAFRLLSLYDLAGYTDEVLTDNPLLFWPLNETSGTSIADIATGDTNHPGTNKVAAVVTPVVSVAGPLKGGQTALDFGTTTKIDLVTDAPADLAINGNLTLEFWFWTDTTPGARANVVFSGELYQVYLSTARKIQFTHIDSAGEQSVLAATALSTGTWYHVACVRDNAARTLKVYINGVLDATAAYTGSPGAGGTFSGPGLGSSVSGWDGRMADFTIFNTALGSDRIAAHYRRTIDATVGGRRVDQALTDVLDDLGWPAAERTLGTGKTLLPAHIPSGNALDYMLSIAEDAERGFLFVAGDGKITFLDRDALLSDTTVDTDFGDGTFGTTSEINYADIRYAFDDQFLFPIVSVTRDGGTAIIVSDATSKARYGPRTLSVDGLLLASDLEATDLANYLLSRYKDSHLRVDSMLLIGASNNFHLNEIHNRQLGDRVTVERRPPGGGLVYQTVEIVGIEHDMPTVGTIRTTFRLAPARNLPQFWILDHTTYSILDSTTTLGY